MKRMLASLALLAALAPVAARADQTSAMLNALAVEQTIDVVTTMAVLKGGGYERDPLAAPFTHSAAAQLGAAMALNLVARRMPVRLLKTVVYVYPVILLGNVRALGAQSSTAGMIGGSTAAGIGLRPRQRR